MATRTTHNGATTMNTNTRHYVTIINPNKGLSTTKGFLLIEYFEGDELRRTHYNTLKGAEEAERLFRPWRTSRR